MVLIAFFVGRGVWRGFVNEWSGFLGLIVGYWVIQTYALMAGDWLAHAFELSAQSALLVAKFTVFFAAYLSIVLLGKALTKVLKLVWLGWLNRIAGGLSGLAKGVVFSALLLAFYLQVVVPKFHISQPWQGESWVYTCLLSAGTFMLDAGQQYLTP